MGKKKYNTDYMMKIFCYENSNPGEFNRMVNVYEMMGYKIKNTLLCTNGFYKLIGKLKKKEVRECLLKEKQISMDEKYRDRSFTNPQYCTYYHRDGICLCANKSFNCLYQDKKSNRKILKKMVKEYKKKSEDKQASQYYEDTKLGRIFSKTYDHFNSKELRGVYREI